MKKHLLTFTALLALAASAHAAAPSSFFFAADNDDPHYAAGMKALNAHDYQKALSEFDMLAHGRNNPQEDAAMYWKAYTLSKMNRGSEAIATCNALKAGHGNSSWNKDCKALAIRDTQVRVIVSDDGNTFSSVSTGTGTGRMAVLPPLPPAPPLRPLDGTRVYVYDYDSTLTSSGDPQQDIKMLALNSVLRDDPNKAIPQLRTLLQSDSHAVSKSHIIFMLAQSKNPEAQNILNDALGGKLGADAQGQAIRMWPLYRTKGSTASLVQAYKSTSDEKLKRAVLTDLFIARDAQSLVDLAHGEKDLEKKRQIVSQLANMHDKVAQDYMLELLK